jgi:hypothetical protein
MIVHKWKAVQKGRSDSVIRLAEKLSTAIVQNSSRNMSSGGNQDLKLFVQHGNAMAVGIKRCRMMTFGIGGFGWNRGE